jgi:hypothetical protein
MIHAFVADLSADSAKSLLTPDLGKDLITYLVVRPSLSSQHTNDRHAFKIVLIRNQTSLPAVRSEVSPVEAHRSVPPTRAIPSLGFGLEHGIARALLHEGHALISFQLLHGYKNGEKELPDRRTDVERSPTLEGLDDHADPDGMPTQ